MVSRSRNCRDVSGVKWASFIPPTAKVKSAMKASFNAEGKLVADDGCNAVRRRIRGARRAI